MFDLKNWDRSAKILALTGHRPDKLNKGYNLIGPCSTYLRQELKKILDELKPEKVISGMALGADTLWAEIALESNIPVIAAIPFKGQESKWPLSSQQRYQQILNNSLVTTHVVCEGDYHPYKMQVRNEYMCDEANALVAIWNGSSGGTANCIKYAKTINLPIYRIIDPNGWKQEKIFKEPTLF